MYITDYIDLPNEIYNNQHLCSHNFRKEVCFIYKIYLLLYAKFAISDTILHASTYIFIISSIWLGNQIKVETIFFLIISMQSLDLAFKRGIPRGIHEMIKLVAVLRRIGKVLRTVDAQSPSKRKNQEKLPAKITLSNLDVHSRGCKILENVNFEICNGLTVVITGSTASGKSLLLQVILGEYEAVAGRLSINGGISYASQQPWLFASTIRQNILFGTKYNEERYLKEFLKDKLVILVTQNPRHISGADNVIILNEQTAKFLSISSRHLLQQEIQNLGIAWKEDNSKKKEDVTEEDVHEITNLLSERKLEKNIYEERVISGRINLGSYKKFIAHGGGSVIFTVICIVFGVVLITKSSLKKLENNW
jgi:Fe-S cluster assembly ATPase SufC